VDRARRRSPSTLGGSFVLSDASDYGITDDGAGSCAGTGGYVDITNGTEVAVYSADGMSTTVADSSR
jgi:hypothetical protein